MPDPPQVDTTLRRLPFAGHEHPRSGDRRGRELLGQARRAERRSCSTTTAGGSTGNSSAPSPTTSPGGGMRSSRCPPASGSSSSRDIHGRPRRAASSTTADGHRRHLVEVLHGAHASRSVSSRERKLDAGAGAVPRSGVHPKIWRDVGWTITAAQRRPTFDRRSRRCWAAHRWGHVDELRVMIAHGAQTHQRRSRIPGPGEAMPMRFSGLDSAHQHRGRRVDRCRCGSSSPALVGCCPSAVAVSGTVLGRGTSPPAGGRRCDRCGGKLL